MMEGMEEKIDEDIDKTISTKCIKGHKFQVPREKIQTSSTGKSFVTLCPKCNGVARLRKDEVYEMFSVNPRDHVAVGKLYESLAIGNAPAQGHTSTTPPTVESPPEMKPNVVDEYEDADLDDEDDDTYDRDYENGDAEYTATVETVKDVTGKGKTVNRFRILAGDDETEDEIDDGSGYEEPRTRIASKPAAKNSKNTGRSKKKSHAQVVESYEDEGEYMEEDEVPQRRSRSRAKPQRARQIVEEEVFDPNDILKDLIEEAGLDENTLARIFDYIDMQPDGWQPAAIQGVLQMYISPASATKLSQRYQAEIYKEEKKRQRDQQMMNMLGAPSSSMQLFDRVPNMNSNPINAPLRQNGFGPNSGFPPQGFDTRQGFGSGFPPRNNEIFPPQLDQNGYPQQYSQLRPPAPRSMSAFDVERIIDAKLEGVVDKLAKAMGENNRVDIAAQESKEMRMMFMEMLKDRMGTPATQDTKPDSMVAQMMQNQAQMVNTLMTHSLSGKKDDDPMNSPIMKILLNEVLSKKSTSAPPLANTSEELSQRIQLQRLANDLELAQADFKDKQDGRAFTRDLAGQALSKIGESVASAYIETQRIQAETSKEIAARQAEVAVASISAQPRGNATGENAAPRMTTRPRTVTNQDPDQIVQHKVKGVPSENGTVTMPCPTCGADMTAKVGDPKVTCDLCKTTYVATTPHTTRVETEPVNADTTDYSDWCEPEESEQMAVSDPNTESGKEPKISEKKSPKVIL